MVRTLTVLVIVFSAWSRAVHAFVLQPPAAAVAPSAPRRATTRLWEGKAGNQQYRNVATEFLSNFMQSKEMTEEKADPLASVDFGAPKLVTRLPLVTLAAVLDYELYEKEWFVTGQVNPIYFADTFLFQDPDVTLEGIEAYARGVNTLFADNSRAEIIETVVNPALGDNVITCKWRLSGKVNIGPAGLTIKPYIVYSDLTVDPETGLIVAQEDRFDIPQWDILLSSLFPFLIGKVCYIPCVFVMLSYSLVRQGVPCTQSHSCCPVAYRSPKHPPLRWNPGLCPHPRPHLRLASHPLTSFRISLRRNNAVSIRRVYRLAGSRSVDYASARRCNATVGGRRLLINTRLVLITHNLLGSRFQELCQTILELLRRGLVEKLKGIR
jgi:hypothetical protein